MNLALNKLRPAQGSKKVKHRVGRGIGSGSGKTCGRGHKGQTARSGYSRKVGFEGGQMPLQRRLPKYGFTSLDRSSCVEVRLSDLNKVFADKIDIATLKSFKIVPLNARRVKIILAGALLQKEIVISGLQVTKGALKAIEAVGGKVE